MGRRAVLVSLVIAGAGATIIAGSALADRTVITDPAGDGIEAGHARLDIRAAEATHRAAARGTKLSHSIRVEDGNISLNDTFLVIRAHGRRYQVKTGRLDRRISRRRSRRLRQLEVPRGTGSLQILAPCDRTAKPIRWQAFTRLPDRNRFDAAPDTRRVLHVLD